jgi:hypothetical protein
MGYDDNCQELRDYKRAGGSQMKVRSAGGEEMSNEEQKEG